MCTLNIALAGKNGLTADVYEAILLATYEDYKGNDDGMGWYYNGKDKPTVSFKWEPLDILHIATKRPHILLTHTRKATVAHTAKESLQPFVFKDRFIAMHNGIIRFQENDSRYFSDVHSDSFRYFDYITEMLMSEDMDVADPAVPMIAVINSATDFLITASSYYSCFLYDTETEQAYYWRHGAVMKMYDGTDLDDMIYLSTQDKSKLIGIEQEQVTADTLYHFTLTQDEETKESYWEFTGEHDLEIPRTKRWNGATRPWSRTDSDDLDLLFPPNNEDWSETNYDTQTYDSSSRKNQTDLDRRAPLGYGLLSSHTTQGKVR